VPLGEMVVRGRLEPSEGVHELAAFSLAPTTALGEVLVAEGQTVHKGDLVATLRSRTQALAALEAARAGLVVAESRLELTQHPYKEAAITAQQAAVRARVADLTLAEAQIHRSALLRNRGIVSDEANDVRSAEVSRANANLEEAKARLQATTEVPPGELLLARAEVAAARARVAVAEQELGLTEIRAPITGRILKTVAKSGELVSNRAIMYIGDIERLKIVAEVDERLVPKLRIGQQVRASVRGLDAEWSGTVSRIGGIVVSQTRPAADTVTGQGGRIVEVDAALKDQTGLPPISGLELLVHIDAR
jgi:HlyD family secretion protein